MGDLDAQTCGSSLAAIRFVIDAKISFEQSGAFIERFALEATPNGPLSDLTFAVKDLMDVAGHYTSCGNPDWKATHPIAVTHAVCVQQLLAAGARCVGKTITDELAYSLIGENFFYGTPLNPKAPDRVPGGSSSGSASAVACGLVDFALGTDTGGSVRVPAGNCGIWGIRTTHGRVSTAGVNPLSPTFDTVGILARNADVLSRATSVLLSTLIPADAKPSSIYLLREAFELCDAEVSQALRHAATNLFGQRLREISMGEIDDEPQETLRNWYEIYRVLQRAEAVSCLGSWVEATKPKFGPLIAESIALAFNVERELIPEMMDRREKYFARMKSFLRETDLICLPTMCSPAPLKGSLMKRGDPSSRGYYPRALSLTSIAGVARAPQVSMPVADLNGVPLGLSLMARTGEDPFLLSVILNHEGTKSPSSTK
jgi:amidase